MSKYNYLSDIIHDFEIIAARPADHDEMIAMEILRGMGYWNRGIILGLMLQIGDERWCENRKAWLLEKQVINDERCQESQEV